MKRLKVTLLIIFILISLSLVALANEANKKRSFFGSPFADSTLQSAIEHFENSMADFSSFSQSMLKTRWEQDKEGRTMVITPTEKNQKIDIKIENGMIQISSAEEKTAENMRSQSVSTQMMSVPHDCDADKAKISQLAEGVKIFFPYKTQTKEVSPDRIPIKPSNDAIDI